MLTHLKNIFYSTGAAFTLGMIAVKPAAAQTGTVSAGTSGGNDFNEIANNIVDSIADLPGLLTALSYLAGVLFGVLGILKIKDHVEDPNTPLKEGAVKLAAGGALFALPIIYEAMFNTIGDGQEVSAATLQAVDFAVE